MANKQDKIKASTQEHLDIDDITEDMVILKTGWTSLVLLTSAVNFDILSEAEQDATIYAYGALLNSLTFPVQILIRSKKQDISVYYQHLLDAERNQQNPDLKHQIQKYREFIQATVQQKTILDKRFYLIIHFSPLELGVKSLKKQNTQNVRSKAQLVVDAKTALAPRRDHLIKQTARLGLVSRQLTTQELIELFYDIYNPAPTGTQRVILDSASYTTPLVEPDLETPAVSPVSIESQLSGDVAPGSAGVQPLQDLVLPQQPAQTTAQSVSALKSLQDAALRVSQVQAVQPTQGVAQVAPVQGEVK